MNYQEQAPIGTDGVAGIKGVGVGRRFVAVFLDGLILSIIASVIGLLFHNQTAITGTVNFLITMVYFITFEGTRGTTLGKMALGLRVVNQSGAPITMTESVIRNLMRIVDFLPFAYIVGAITVWVTGSNQRLGDMVAHTYVVRK